MAHGHVAQAFHWHPLGPILFAAGLVALAGQFTSAIINKPLPQLDAQIRARVNWSAIAVFLAVGVTRAVYFGVNHLRF